MTSTTHISTRLIQLDVQPGNPRYNTERMLEHIQQALDEGVDLAVFPELAIPGYLIGDLWEQPAFLRECEDCGHALRAASKNITVVFGNVAIDWNKRNEDGRCRKYNALFIADAQRFAIPDGTSYPFYIKTLMPNYRQFDDSRHFFDLRKLAFEQGRRIDDYFTPVRTSCCVLGGLLCEDAWESDYALSPLALLARHSDIEVFVNASASPYTYNKNNKRHRVFAEHARKLKRPLLYVNNVGIQNNGKTLYTFDGASCVYDAKGHCLTNEDRFKESTLSVTIPRANDVAFAPEHDIRIDTIQDLCQALLFGIDSFNQQFGIKKFVIGVSGGIDSAVVAALYRLIAPPENMLLVNMPSRFNAARTCALAQSLAQNLGTPYVSVPIEPSVDVTRTQIDGLVPICTTGINTSPLHLTGFMLENIQARDRSSRILAALASAVGGVFTCNANKSEMTIGYSTLYGDLGGYLAPIADLWKTQVYALADHLNTVLYESPVIPEGSITIKPSAELSEHQDIEKGYGDPLNYPYHDRLFESWVEHWNRSTPEEILQWYADGQIEQTLGLTVPIAHYFSSAEAFINDLERWWNLYQGMGVAKRIQAPPVMAVTRRAFGFDHREAQLKPHYTAAYQKLKNELLAQSVRKKR